MIKLIEASSYSYAKAIDRINQDCILSPRQIDGGFLFAVADGVGSYSGSEKASSLAIDHLSLIKNKDELVYDCSSIFEDIKQKLGGLKHHNPLHGKAATTLTFCYVDSEYIRVGHIGDCRLYIKDGNGRLVQLTKDHTQLQQLVDEKLFTKKFLQDKKVKNILTTAIAMDVSMKYDILQFPLREMLSDDGTVSIYIMSDGAHKFWDFRPRFSQRTMESVTNFATSIKRRIEFFTPMDDYSLVAIKIKLDQEGAENILSE